MDHNLLSDCCFVFKFLHEFLEGFFYDNYEIVILTIKSLDFKTFVSGP
jgi:hypothetical protein